ncbi:Nitrogenase molybdenum-iron protein alpha chain [Bacteroidales bacterium Barb7]|nr:Nitrogenase molybdenum-iron protein alpha chain [Bacteroidales bacterium Barb6XT]OAV75939.1 Nitrogenase molybdenum-iron protein alpha chain [Bacteroidales bacterium Barb7]
MAIDIHSKQCASRESRLGSITGYSGTLQDMGQQVSCSGCPEERKRCFSQASMCNSTCALGQLSGINDAAIVHHGPSGCAATAIGISSNFNLLATALGKDRSHFAYTCTDMTEADTVFGSTENLKDVIRETYNRYHPKAIFIGASCVSGVIGEDLEGVLDDMRGELDIPLAPVHCEGFKSQIWATGFDVSYHAILKYIVKPPKKKSNKVNIIGFTTGTSWNSDADVRRLLGALGLEPTYLLASSSIEELEHTSEAVASVSTCSTLGAYFGVGLETAYGVPYVRSLPPHGVRGYEDYTRQLAKIVGKEREMEAYMEQERALYLPKLEKIKEQLRGKRAMVAMGPGFGSNYARILQEFGMKVEHLSAWHFDKQYDDGVRPTAFQYLLDNSPNDFTYSVNDLQNYEFMNTLNRVNPDVFISRHPGSTVWAMKIGIPAYNVYDEYNSFGYKGTLRFARTLLNIIINRSFSDNLAKHVRLPYTDWWMNQPADTFLEKEELEVGR